jgi:UDP-N-acetylmuramoylalanine--D-glutamate ligase
VEKNRLYSEPLNIRLAILGAGESGVGAALLARAKGYEVFVSDGGTIKAPYRKELEDNRIDFEAGKHSEERILAADLVIKSPGIPDKAAIVHAVHDRKIPVVSEIEFASHFTDGKIIAITGSNGKTTTTSLIWHILNKAGWDAALAGNIGKSLARTVFEREYEYYVVEVSSFQLDDIADFHPHISVITNITEDHLDRYNYQVENYIQSKLSIARNQTEEDYCIYCLDDPTTRQYIDQIKHTVCIPFSWEQTVSEGACIDGDHIIFHLKKNDLPCQ